MIIENSKTNIMPVKVTGERGGRTESEDSIGDGEQNESTIARTI